jgi:predicted enzyme involved in methoxymalonyl-ACP biosynthesis
MTSPNWNSKVDNINSLNIGFDSMVFIDDNPYERNSVKDIIPLIRFTERIYVSFLADQNLFETVTSSNIDKDRTKLYQTE